MKFHYHDARVSVLEGAISRGDRRLNQVIYQAWKDGAKFDGWTDLFKEDVWHEAFRQCGIDMKEYSERTRDFNEPLPWEHTSPELKQSHQSADYVHYVPPYIRT